MFTFHRPVGVWAAITPWNFPVTIPLEYIGPGLAAGNAVIAKPPEFTSWGLLKLAEAFDAAGLPKGLVSIIPGGGEIGETLVKHPGIDAIGFTGSSATGRRILSQMGIKRSVMEMSGNGPTIITEDANLEAAAELAVFGARYNAGQVCCATEKVIVLESVHDEFLERALEHASQIVLGDPFDESTTMGPLNNEPTARKMDLHVDDARERGANVLTGGHRSPGFPTDLYYEFTLIDAVPEDALVSKEETFGPVAPLFRFSTEEEAIALANDTDAGLAAYFYSRDIGRIWRVAEALEYGMVGINEGIISTEVAPFGGVKESGLGREGSKYGIEEFTELKYLCMGGL